MTLVDIVRQHVADILACVSMASNEELEKMGEAIALLHSGGGTRLALEDIARQRLAETKRGGTSEATGDGDPA